MNYLDKVKGVVIFSSENIRFDGSAMNVADKTCMRKVGSMKIVDRQKDSHQVLVQLWSRKEVVEKIEEVVKKLQVDDV